MITPEMIDEKLARRIDGELWPNPSHGSNEEFVSMVLAWLANNPIPVSEVRAYFTAESFPPGFHGEGAYENHVVKEFQRIAYLKKEETIPQELKDIYAEHGFCSADVMDALQKAYKLGKGESK